MSKLLDVSFQTHAQSEPNIRKRTRAMALDQGAVEPAAPLGSPSNEGDADDYEVGYGRPPKATQFKKGISGNKRGRPKGRKNARTIAREALDRKRPVTMDGRRKKMSNMEIGIERQAQKMSEKGDQKAFEFLLRLAGDDQQKSSNETSGGQIIAQLDRSNLEILAYQRREGMLAMGIAPEVVERLLGEMGLVNSVEEKD